MSTYITTATGITNTEILTKTVASDRLVIIYKSSDKINMPDHISLSEKVKAKKEYLEVANKEEMLVVIGSLLSVRTKFIVLDKNIPVPAGLMNKYDISYIDENHHKTVKDKTKTIVEKEENVESELKTKKTRKKKDQTDITAKNKEDKKNKKPVEKAPEIISEPAEKPKRTRRKKVVDDIEVSEEAVKAFEKNMNAPEPAKKKNPFATSLKSSDDLFEHEDAVLVSKRTGIRASDIKEKIEEEALMLLIADAVKNNEKDDDLKFALKTRFSEDDFTSIWNRLRGGLKMLRKDFSEK